MKWAGIMASVVVTIGLIIAVGFLITYLHPANNITQEMDDDHDDWEGKLKEAGEVGGGAGRGGQAGRYKKQEVQTENHGALEVHLLELNEKSEGGKTGESGLGETIIVTIMVIVSITAFCTISGCAYAMWKCGLCPEGRRRRRGSSSRSSSAGSGRKRTHSEDIELGELKLKMRKLERKARKEEEQEKKGQEKETRKEKELELELERDVKETPRAGLRAITSEVGCVPELYELATVSMEDYSKRLDQATKTLRDIEMARMVVDHHKDNIRRGTTMGYIAGGGGAEGVGGR